MRVWLLGFLCIIILAGTASANGLPVTRWPPEVGLLPHARTAVEVVSEQLQFDFEGPQGTLRSWPAVTAQYLLHNPSGSDEHLTIAFLYLRDTPDLTVDWNGIRSPFETISGAVPSDLQLPPELSGAREILWLDPATGQAYERRTSFPSELHAAVFTVELPANSTGNLSVAYSQHPTGCDHCSSRRPFWHYTYLLSPARNWASFRNLQIRVVAPADYQIAAIPVLGIERRDESRAVLVGIFSELPEGELSLSIRRSWWSAYGLLVGIVGGAFGIGVMAVWLGRRTRSMRRNHTIG